MAEQLTNKYWALSSNQLVLTLVRTTGSNTASNIRAISTGEVIHIVNNWH
jgi:hypothetical protein